MNKLLLSVAIIFAVTAGRCIAQKTANDTLVIKTIFYCDHCSQCPSCQPRVERELTFTKGVKSFAVDAKAQTISVIYNPKKISAQAIRQTIAGTGFDADDVKATPEAIAKLDDCCKKN